MGLVSAPIRFTLHLNLVKIKMVKPIEGKRILLKLNVSLLVCKSGEG